MSQGGELCFYRRDEVADPQTLLRSIMMLARPESVPIIARSLFEDNDWDTFKNGEDPVPTESFSGKATPAEIPSLYRRGTRLMAELVGSPLASRVMQAIEKTIPASIRGSYLPTDIFLTAGFHDIWEDAEEEEGHLFARAFLSIGFFGYGTPDHWKAFRQMVFEIPEVQAVKRELEAVAGPLEQCVFWSV